MIMSQEIKFQRPVFLGDQLTLEASVIDIHQSVNLIEFAYKFRNAADGKAVATGKINIVKTTVSEEI